MHIESTQAVLCWHNMRVCDVCEVSEKEAKLETFSYRVVCQEGTINIDTTYCTACCDKIENEVKDEEHE